MKIVFESEAEKEEFINNQCPDHIKSSLERYSLKNCCHNSCDVCWEQCGIDLEVSDDPGDPDFDYED